VNEDIFATDRVASTREAFSKVCEGAFEGMITMKVKFDEASGESSKWSSQEKKELFNEMVKELEGGKAYYWAEIKVVSGRKAG
jgi:hypothetical protein